MSAKYPPLKAMANVGRVVTSNDELVTVRDAMRGLNRMIVALATGEREKFVLTKGGKMVAAVVSIECEAYDQLLWAEIERLREALHEVAQMARGGERGDLSVSWRQFYETAEAAVSRESASRGDA